MFNSATAEQQVSAGASASAVAGGSTSPEDTSTRLPRLGQMEAAPAATSYSAGGIDAVQQLQMQAMLAQQQATVMLPPQNASAAAVATGQASLYQKALMQQMLVAQGSMGAPSSSGGVPAPAAVVLPPSAPVSVVDHHTAKRQKTAQEMEDQIERTKKRRRESAQRSRQRKNCYMRSLEIENEALKQEVGRLRAELSRSSLAPGAGSAAAASEGCKSVASSQGAPAVSPPLAGPLITVGQPHHPAMGVPVGDLSAGFCTGDKMATGLCFAL